MQKTAIAHRSSSAGNRIRPMGQTMRFMRMLSFFLFAATMAVSARPAAQTISLSGRDLSLKQVFYSIKKQTGYLVFANEDLLDAAKHVSLSVKNMDLTDFLSLVLKDQPLSYRLDGNTIFIAEKKPPLFSPPAKPIRIHVTDSAGHPLSGASVLVKNSKLSGVTNGEGLFNVNVREGDVLLVSYIGYEPRSVIITPSLLSSSNPLTITLRHAAARLGDVEVTVNTGYQAVPQERATGSFTQIDNKLFNRATGGNVLDRLEGVTNGLLFTRRNLTKENLDAQPQIRINGVSTILGNVQPLIIVDNFPYDGDLNSINPNDVESVTVLRDAAAASIWGARAGNGVIVINTKVGQYNQPVRISVNSNAIVEDKPDLFYSQNYLPSPTVMSIQKDLFLKGSYIQNNQIRIPLYAELLYQQKNGQISAGDFTAQETRFSEQDIRRDWTKYLYRTGITQQNSVGIRGGGNNYRYTFLMGYDKIREAYVGNDGHRLNLSLQNTFKVRSNLEVTGTVWYSKRNSHNNAIFSSVTNAYNGAAPDIYESLVDANGNPNALNLQNYRYSYQANLPGSSPSLHLSDWLLRPLNEEKLNNNTTDASDWRLNGGLKYSFLKHFNLDATYQYILSQSSSQTYHDSASYYVHDLVNRFTQSNGTRIIPLGGIMDYAAPMQTISQSGRALLSYSQQFHTEHSVNAIVGTEISQSVAANKPGVTLYNYNPKLLTATSYMDFSTYYPVLPIGSSRVSTSAATVLTSTANRNLSYFGNASYIYKGRYILSGSLRWDGSNLLGVSANQRGTALWSSGLSWDLSKESFYHFDRQLPYLRLRATYGSAGNINRTQTHYPTINFVTSTETALQTASLTTAGNPSLRWEQVNTLNFGTDFRSFHNRITGSIEFYTKDATHLLGSNTVDPTTGVPPTFLLNYAALRTWGWDIQINSRNLTIGKFTWSTSLLFNTSQNKVTRLKVNPPTADNQYLTTTIYEQGSSVDKLYALPWYGLNPNDGSVLLHDKTGAIVKDYQTYYNGMQKSTFINAGSTVPIITSSMMNTFEWKGISLSALLVGRFDFIFRRNSMLPGAEYTNTLTGSSTYNMDYMKRWQKPGDEKFTNVPAKVPLSAISGGTWSYAAAYYQYSKALITPGDVIRLQDISLSYSLPHSLLTHWAIQGIRIYGYARSLGILWRANHQGLDPDYPGTIYPAPKSYSAGVQIDF